jgi:hypothetical protein
MGPKRVDAWFELHRWGQDWLTGPYREFLARQPLVYTLEAVPEVPKADLFPWQELVRQFGPYFFTSTPAWMLAHAITLKPDEIGLWGIDMAANGEYDAQKPGCLHFIELARDRGIKITTPAESDLLAPPPLYGVCEMDPKMIKWQVRDDELARRRQAVEQQIETLTKESLFLAGALDSHRYTMRTWSQ